MISMKLTIEQIPVFMYLLPHLPPLSAAAYFGKQTVLFHNSENSLWVPPYLLTLQPKPHSPVAVGIKAAFLLSPNEHRQFRILFRPVHFTYEIIITASGYAEETAHDRDGIFFPMSVNNVVLDLRPHLLSVDCRKSRSSLFSIFKR